MGHYRPRRPRLNEDPMKPVEHLYETVDKIKQGNFRGFSRWTPGVPTPEEHTRRRLGRLRALNHGVEPRVGFSVIEARNHSRYIKAMVNRIENLQSPTARSVDPSNPNMHPAFLRRPLTKRNRKKVETEPLKKRKKLKKWECIVETITDKLRTPQTEQDLAKYPKTARQHCPGQVVIKEGTPFCFTPKPETKLIDGTHLCDRYHYDDAKSQKKYFSGADNSRLEKAYREVVDNPQGLATLFTKPWKAPPPPLPDYDPEWSIDMRLPDLPSDLKATPSRHTLDDPFRPSSSRKRYTDAFVEPNALYDENWVPLPLPCNIRRSDHSPERSMTDSCPTPTTPACSRSKHVHRKDLEQNVADPVGDDMRLLFGETIRNLHLVPGPQTFNAPFSTEIQDPLSPVYTSGAQYSVSSTGSVSAITGTPPETSSEAEEGEIPPNYKPQDQPFWTFPSCCSTPY